jgi:hypothetical protein
MNDYGEMFYGTLPPDTQDFRQVLSGIGRTLRDRANLTAERFIQSAQEARALQDQAFGDPTRPTRVTDEAALRKLTDMIMAGPMGFAPAGITAYHGSPYLFRQFDPAKVGAGEGAQAYGVGAGYTAEARPVAQRYAEILANRDTTNQNRLNPHANAKRLVDLAGDPKYAADDVRFAIESNPDNPQKELLSKTLDYIESGKYAEPLQTSGYLYKGDIPDEILPKFLDWDKPLSQQSEEIKQFARNVGFLKPATMSKEDVTKMVQDRGENINPSWRYQVGSFPSAPTPEKAVENAQNLWKETADVFSYGPARQERGAEGQRLYDFLVEKYGSQKAASELMEKSGLRGIRYLDQGSRGEGKGTSNFVPFRSEDFKIQEINDIPIQQYIEQGLL